MKDNPNFVPLTVLLNAVGVDDLAHSLDVIYDIALYESDRIIDVNEKEALLNISHLKKALLDSKG